MSSFKSKLIIFAIQNRHLFKLQFKREVITRETSTIKLRQEFEEAAKRMDTIPPSIKVSPVTIPATAGRRLGRVRWRMNNPKI